MKKNIPVLFAIAVTIFACSKDDSSPDKIDIPAEFQNLTTQNWYFNENYDTTYSYYDSVRLVNDSPLPPITGRKVPLLANACGQNTAYRFREDGKFLQQTCDFQTGIIGSWSIKENPAANNEKMVYLSATNGDFQTPFSDTPIPSGQGAFLTGMTLTGNTKLKVYNYTGRFYGVRVNDSTGVGGADFTITNRVFKSQ